MPRLLAPLGVSLALLAPLALALSSFAACSSSTTAGGTGGTGGADAGPDAVEDAPADAPQDSPTDAPQDSPTDAPAEAGPCALLSPFSSQNKPCNDCAEAHCCQEINGCLGDPACNDDYVNCTLACALDFDAGPDAGPSDCFAICGEQYPAGKVEYDLAFGCVDQQCLGECQ